MSVNKANKGTETNLVASKQKEEVNIGLSTIFDENRLNPYSYSDNIEDNHGLVYVKFFIDKEVFATAFKLATTVAEIKESLAAVLDLEQDLISLKKDNTTVEESLTMADLGASPYSKSSFQLSSTMGREGEEVMVAKIKAYIPTVNVITVHLGEAGDCEDIVVEIENQFCQKEWLGGYRDKRSNKDYHHSTTQTASKKRSVFQYTESGEAIPLVYNRDTQTSFKPRDFSSSTAVNKTTQMWKSDLFIMSKTDKIMTPFPYQSHSELNGNDDNVRAAITIQKAVKNWIHEKRIKTIVYNSNILLEDMRKQKAQIIKEQADKEREIITSAAYPVKRDDFYMLYLMVDNWWKREWKRVCDLRSTAAKNAESVLLLQKEVKLLENIEKHRIVGKKEALKKERMRFLQQTARPVTFKNAKGQMASIDDIDTQRAREYKEIYSAIIRDDILPKNKIDVLLTLKHLFVSNFMDYEYAGDIISLIHREIDLLSIGTNFKSLRGLHERIRQLFLNFLEQKEFNPKAAKYKKPNWPKTMDDLFQCTRCLKMLPVSKYPVHVRMRAYTVCKSCVWLQNIGHQRVDMSPYLKLLKCVQNSEVEKCCFTAVCFILQPIGMAHLTNVIWHGHSAISECRDMSKLQHLRWLSDVEWAPWNTILLTDQEAKCHTSISDVFKFYTERFVESVRQKHILARHCFIPLLKMDHDIRTSGVWAGITDSGPFLHPSNVEKFSSENNWDVI